MCIVCGLMVTTPGSKTVQQTKYVGPLNGMKLEIKNKKKHIYNIIRGTGNGYDLCPSLYLVIAWLAGWTRTILWGGERARQRINKRSIQPLNFFARILLIAIYLYTCNICIYIQISAFVPYTHCLKPAFSFFYNTTEGQPRPEIQPGA